MEAVIYPVLFERMEMMDHTNAPWKCTEWDWDIIADPSWNPDIFHMYLSFYGVCLHPNRCFDPKADIWMLRTD